MKEALQILESGAWCGLRYITADDRKKTGGEVIEVKRCRIARKSNMARQAQHDKGDGIGMTAGNNRKNPNHGLNFTRNIELQNRLIRTIHPILITHINGLAVV